MERLRELHAEGLRRWKGKPGEVDPYSGCLESVVGGARTALGYHDAPVSDAGLTYASFLLQKAATRHCMNDGNKRLAWLACVESVLMMGMAVDATDDEAQAFLEDRVMKHCAIIEIVSWLRTRLRQFG